MKTAIWSSRLGSPLRCVLLVAIAAIPALGGEKATISVPTKPSAAANPALTRPPSTSFEALDNNSSIGGVIDSAAAPSAPTVNIPDAKTQKELIERLDRRKNWLLDDSPSRGRAGGDALMLDPGVEVDYSTNPRRPQTALERRLKGGSRTSATEAAEREARQQAFVEERDDRLERNFGLDTFQRDGVIDGLTPAWSGSSGNDRGMGILGLPASGTGSTEPLRTSVSGNLNRAAGLDSMSQERLERYQRTFGLEDSPERTTSLGATVDHSRSRELRTEVMGQLLGAGSDPRALPAVGLSQGGPADASTLARNSLSPPALSGAVSNPYAAAPAPPEPYVSPAEKMLRAPAVQIPRFRP